MTSSTDDELGTSNVSKTPRAPKPASMARHSKPANATSTKPRARRAQPMKAPPTGRGSKDNPMDIDHSDSIVVEPARGGKGKNKTTNVAEAVPSKVGEGDDDVDTGMDSTVTTTNNPIRLQKAIVSRVDHERESLKKKVHELERVIASHRQTLEEVLAVRNTEAEQILEEQRQLWETRLATQQETIQELTSNLARVEPLSRSGTGSVLHLLTRDAADEEKKALVSEIAQLKATIAEKDSLIAEGDKRIREYTQQERELRYEIKMLEERKPSTKPTPRQTAPADPKIGEIIRFYEDITELPVVSINHQGTSQHSNNDEWLLRCIYSVSDTTSNAENQAFSLDFSVRTHFEASPEGKAKETLHYVPLSLDKEKPEFVDRLDFLKAPFTFERSQLAVFLRTLRDTLTEAISPQEDDQEESRTAIEID